VVHEHELGAQVVRVAANLTHVETKMLRWVLLLQKMNHKRNRASMKKQKKSMVC
jgi:hypothetical protein